MTKRISPLALNALKEALSHVYWYKKDLLGFLKNSLQDALILTNAGCEPSLLKRDIAGNLVDYLANDQERHLGSIRRLIQDACEFSSFSHLEKLDDGTNKATRAKEAVRALQEIVKDHDAISKEQAAATERRKQAAAHTQKLKASQQRLAEIKANYAALVMSKNPQQRGTDLEKLLHDLFDLYDLDPKAAFKIKGEQIDGAFSLDNTEYLFEAKWQQEPILRADLDAFKAKIERKLDNTLGVFLSINKFSDNAVSIYSTTGSKFFLMTGADLMAVLDERVSFPELLQRKKRHASTTGQVLLEHYQF